MPSLRNLWRRIEAVLGLAEAVRRFGNRLPSWPHSAGRTGSAMVQAPAEL